MSQSKDVSQGKDPPASRHLITIRGTQEADVMLTDMACLCGLSRNDMLSECLHHYFTCVIESPEFDQKITAKKKMLRDLSDKIKPDLDGIACLAPQEKLKTGT